jgi:SAM-dependent methyltransferase
LPEKCQLLACDISLSRLRVGRRFAERMMRGDLAKSLKLFVADMARLPLADSSVDVVFTSHALEPNHGREEQLLKELLRVTRRHLLLFEPSWENADQAVRDRMAQHGYVRDLPQHIQAAGGRLVSVEPLPNPLNPMNPTYCYVVEPINKASQPSLDGQVFQCPRSGHVLQKQQSYWWSQEGGWAYPEIDSIACLREKHGVLMSHA